MNDIAPQHGKFPRATRLTCKSDFQRVFARGKKVWGRVFVCYVLMDGTDVPRLGLVVSRKVGNAVTRNRVKRHIREFFRQNRHRMPPGMQLVVVARAASAALSGNACMQELGRMLGSHYGVDA